MLQNQEKDKDEHLEKAMSSEQLDDMPVTIMQLAKIMHVSRWTISALKGKGYKFLYGKRTTRGHLKAWMAEHAEDLKPVGRKPKVQASQEDQRAVDMELSKLKSKKASAGLEVT